MGLKISLICIPSLVYTHLGQFRFFFPSKRGTPALKESMNCYYDFHISIFQFIFYMEAFLPDDRRVGDERWFLHVY